MNVNAEFTHAFSFIIAEAARVSHVDPTAIVFIAELVLMLVVGRILGEVMVRLRQPEVMGQLIAGILIGPTVFGTLWPGGHDLLFPGTPELKKMVDAIAQIGVLMLLLLAGMETDFAIVKRQKRTAVFASISGIILPFACGFVLGELLPEAFLPAPEKRLLTALFLATALSISSVKIVAMVIMEVDFMRRNIGQLILASAIIDDTIGWIIVAVISGIAAEGVVNLKSIGLTAGGTIIFLVLSLVWGRTIVAHIIRWTNDRFHVEFSVLSVVLILTCAMAVITGLIGVHTVLGAFVMGILVGQSPMMTDHIREQLRGIVIALFAPVFFAVAGLSVDLTILKDLHKLELAIALILIASLGKLLGCFTGGKLGGLTGREALALAVGMNARGTTEVIVATIGLSIGVLTKDFYTLIVVMAVTTTMIMPPMLRWALTRIPATGPEQERLEREEAEASDVIPGIERLLIAADDSECGRMAAQLGGLFVGTRRIMATVLELASDAAPAPVQTLLHEQTSMIVKLAVEAAHVTKLDMGQSDEDAAPTTPAQLTNLSSNKTASDAILNELKNGYDLLFVGLESALSESGQIPGTLSSSIEQIVRDFRGTVVIAIARNQFQLGPGMDSLNILVPTTGTTYSRIAAEVAIALAKGCKCGLTALNVSPPSAGTFFAKGNHNHLRPGRAVLKDIEAMGMRQGVSIRSVVELRPAPEAAILDQIRKGKHNLLVLGANVRPGDGLFFGHSVKTLMQRTTCSVLIVSS
jgi:Kef-type K+ transport system membrane component KefB/nucleotide-binding universal stress UspA family protein